jgi:hypothetical protein
VFSFPAALAALMVGGIFVPLRNFWVDPDVWWHIRVGDTILLTHRWPTVDPYSFTAHGTPWIAYEWLGEVVLALANRAWGLRGLMFYDYVLAVVIVLLLYVLTTLRCGNSKAAFVACAIMLPLVYPSCSVRPQMIGYVFLLLTLILLERFRTGHTRGLWWLPPMFLVWVNEHGSFVLGVFALVVYWASGLVEIHWGGLESRLWTAPERVRLELVGFFSLIALTITPYGTEICLYPANMAFGQPINVANIQEWQAMTFGDVFGKLFLAVILGFILAQIVLRPTWRLAELVLFFAGFTAACMHLRLILLFVPFCAPLFAVILAHWVPPYEPTQDKYALNAILMTLVLAGVIWFFPTRAALEKVMEHDWPVRAAVFLRQHPQPQPLLNSYGYGGYMIWQLSDRYKVFIDGRGDLYERVGVFSDYLAMFRLAYPASRLLKAYNIQTCFIGRQEALAALLDASPDWQQVYGDPLSVIYVKKQ